MVGLNKNKITCIILMFFIVLLLTLFSSSISNADSDAALIEGQSLWASQKCVCQDSYSSITPNKNSVSGKIDSIETNHALRSFDNQFCYYGNGDIKVPCTGMPGNVLMSRYINAGLMDSNEADKFVQNASTYAAYVQEGLSTKTQSGKVENLGNGPFNRAMFEFNQNAHFVYSFLIGFAFITSLLVFVLIFVKITWLPDYPMQRRLAMEDIVTSGIATVLLGGIWILISLFQSMFDKFWSTYAIYSKDWKTVGNMFLYEYKGLVTGILGIATLTALLMFIKNFASLSLSEGNTPQRKQKIMSILLTGIATAGLGGLTVFAGFFWNLLN